MEKVYNNYSGVEYGEFVRKAANYKSFKNDLNLGRFSTELYKIMEVYEMKPEEWEHFKNNFFGSYEFLKGKGGSVKVQGRYVTKAILVRCGSDGLLVNPEGYDYPRYISKF